MLSLRFLKGRGQETAVVGRLWQARKNTGFREMISSFPVIYKGSEVDILNLLRFRMRYHRMYYDPILALGLHIRYIGEDGILIRNHSDTLRKEVPSWLTK